MQNDQKCYDPAVISKCGNPLILDRTPPPPKKKAADIDSVQQERKNWHNRKK